VGFGNANAKTTAKVTFDIQAVATYDFVDAYTSATPALSWSIPPESPLDPIAILHARTGLPYIERPSAFEDDPFSAVALQARVNLGEVTNREISDQSNVSVASG